MPGEKQPVPVTLSAAPKQGKADRFALELHGASETVEIAGFQQFILSVQSARESGRRCVNNILDWQSETWWQRHRHSAACHRVCRLQLTDHNQPHHKWHGSPRCQPPARLVAITMASTSSLVISS